MGQHLEDLVMSVRVLALGVFWRLFVGEFVWLISQAFFCSSTGVSGRGRAVSFRFRTFSVWSQLGGWRASCFLLRWAMQPLKWVGFLLVSLENLQKKTRGWPQRSLRAQHGSLFRCHGGHRGCTKPGESTSLASNFKSYLHPVLVFLSLQFDSLCGECTFHLAVNEFVFKGTPKENPHFVGSFSRRHPHMNYYPIEAELT